MIRGGKTGASPRNPRSRMLIGVAIVAFSPTSAKALPYRPPMKRAAMLLFGLFSSAFAASSAMPEKLPSRIDAPEGVAVDARGNLYTSATRGGATGGLSRLRHRSHAWENWGMHRVPGTLLGLAVDEKRRLLYACAPDCEGGSILAYPLDAESPKTRTVARHLGSRFINGVAIHGDSLYVSFSGNIPGFIGGRIWRLTLDSSGVESRREIFANLTFPNGLVTSQDGRYLYVAQSMRGFLAGRFTVFDTQTRESRFWKLSGLPDGVALDEKNQRLYIALQSGGGVLAVEERHVRLDADPRPALPVPLCPPCPNPAEPDGTWNPASLTVTASGDIIFTDPWRIKRPWDRITLIWKGNPTHHHLWRWKLPAPSKTHHP